MPASSVVTGARAKLGIYDPATGKTNIVGIFNNVSYSLSYDTADLYILGRYSAGAIEYTAAEVVTLSCGGFRAVKKGPHVVAGVPALQDLLNSEYLQIAIIDRQLESTGVDGRFAKFTQARCTGYSTDVAARGVAGLTVGFKAIILSDESVTNSENPESVPFI